MQSHGGNIKNCDCIARFFYVCALRCKVRIRQHKKMLTTMVRRRPPNPVPKNSPNMVVLTIRVMRRPLALSREGAPTLRSPSNHVPSKKNNHFHPNSWSAQTSEFGRTRKKSRVIFDPANSGLSVPPPPLKVRGRECNLRSKARWVYYILHIFIQKMSQILTFYCAIIPVAASNTQQSTENEGKIKVIGGGWLFWCYKKLTAKIGQQRKKGIFCDRWRGPMQLLLLLSTTQQSTSKLSNLINSCVIMKVIKNYLHEA